MLRAALLLAAPLAFAATTDVLIVADEIPAMEVLAASLKEGAGASTTIVKQPELPADLAPYRAVVVYIHKNIDEATEKACLRYASEGGRLMLLHHSISSGKRKNREWLPSFGVTLPEGDFAQGGYKWLDPVNWELVNLAPGNQITSAGVVYPAKTEYNGVPRPALPLEHSEVYLNHALAGPRTVLLGLKYTDPKTGKTYMQDTAGWYRPAGKGWVLYFMPGHTVAEFENPAYARILVNAYKARLR